MTIEKCDICKKEIKDRSNNPVAGMGWVKYSFCDNCGKPIVNFLKKHKFIKIK